MTATVLTVWLGRARIIEIYKGLKERRRWPTHAEYALHRVRAKTPVLSAQIDLLMVLEPPSVDRPSCP